MPSVHRDPRRLSWRRLDRPYRLTTWMATTFGALYVSLLAFVEATYGPARLPALLRAEKLVKKARKAKLLEAAFPRQGSGGLLKRDWTARSFHATDRS